MVAAMGVVMKGCAVLLQTALSVSVALPLRQESLEPDSLEPVGQMARWWCDSASGPWRFKAGACCQPRQHCGRTQIIQAAGVAQRAAALKAGRAVQWRLVGRVVL